MPKPKLPSIPTTFLPEGWRESVAEEFKVSASKVGQIVYGLGAKTPANQNIWDHVLQLAEAGKAADESKQEENAKRLLALQQA
jgi:hypothetical protein